MLAPSACRVASSRTRPLARTETRLAMLTHPISRTQSTPPHKQVERAAGAFDQIALKRLDLRVEPGVHQDFFQRRKSLEVCRVDRIDLGLRLLDRVARLEPSHLLPVVAVAALVGPIFRGKRHRHPQLDVGIDEAERGGHDANDAVQDAVHPKVASERVVSAAEEPLPQAIAEHDLLVVADLGFFLGEELPAMRLRLQEAEERRRHLHRRHAFDLAGALTANRHAGRAIHRNLFERGGLREAIVIVGNAIRTPEAPPRRDRS